jgi:tetraacyldisaccharide 4'-kinase
MDSRLQRIWYGRSPWSWLLWPLSILFRFAAAVRRVSIRSIRVERPVIVVGNITVGGTGKTPLTIWLARQLSARGYRPAVIMRGYGGTSSVWPVDVTAQSDPAAVGDEAVLIATLSGAPVIAGPDRVADARRAIANGADVIISDDGLQHYRLARDIEIAVVDGARMFGNGQLLPAGPLRESTSRLDSVSAVAVTLRAGQASAPIDLEKYRPITVRSEISEARSLTSSELRPLRSFSGLRVHALAGIGNPEAFFAALRAHGLKVDGRSLPDHARLSPAELIFGDDAPVFMTEKDAVKCLKFADKRCWVVPIQTEVEGAEKVLSRIEQAIRSR